MILDIHFPRTPRGRGMLAAELAMAVFVSTGASACGGTGNSSGQNTENNTSQQDLSTYERVEPAPHFPYSDIRHTAIEAEASQALGEQTTSFFFLPGDSTPLFQCPSDGDPVPFSTEITNPDQVYNDPYPNGGQAVAIGNIDPNGVYLPSDAEGTNVMCLDASGKPYLTYWEGYVWAVNGNATWNGPGTPPLRVTGGINMPTCKTEQVKGKPTTVCVK